MNKELKRLEEIDAKIKELYAEKDKIIKKIVRKKPKDVQIIDNWKQDKVFTTTSVSRWKVLY